MSTKVAERRGRPRKSSAKRDKTISFRVSESERKHLEEGAKHVGQELSDWARDCLMASWPPKPVSKKDVLLSRVRGEDSDQFESLFKSRDITLTFLCKSCADLKSKVANRDLSKPDEIDSQVVMQILMANRKLTSSLRGLAIASKAPAIIEELLLTGIDICQTLAHHSILDEVKSVASNYPSFPLAFYNHPNLNGRAKRLLEEIKPGSNLRGLRPEAKWQRDEFLEHAISILDHMEGVRVELKRKLQVNKTKKCSITKFDEISSGAKELLESFPEFTKDELSSIMETCNLLHRDPRLRLSMDEKAKVWKTIDNVIIEGSLSKKSLLNYQFSWQGILADGKLRMAVMGTCQNNTRSERAEIKKRIKAKLFAVADMLNSPEDESTQSLWSKESSIWQKYHKA